MSPDSSDKNRRADDTRFHELGRRAGAELRRPAEDDGIRHIARTARRRRAASAATIVGVVAAGIAAVGLATSSDPDKPTVAATTTTLAKPVSTTASSPTSTTSQPTTTVGTTTTLDLLTNAVLPTVPPTAQAGAGGGISPARTFELPTEGPLQRPHGRLVRFLPNGEMFLIGDWNGRREYVIDSDSGTIVRVFPGTEVFAPKVFSSDSSRYFDGGRLWDMTTGEEILVTHAYGAAISPDGRWLAVKEGTKVRLLDIRDGSELWATDIPTTDPLLLLLRPMMRYSEDSSRVHVGDWTFDVKTGQVRPERAQPVTRPTTGFWNPGLVAELDGPYQECNPPFASWWDTSRCDVSVDGTQIAMVDESGDVVQIWHTES